MELDDILSGKEAPAQGKEAPPRDEAGKFAATEAPKVASEAPKEATPPAEQPKAATEPPTAPTEPPKQQLTPQERAFLARAQDEARKRQALERELAELRAKQPKEPEKTFWDDPDGALRRQAEQAESLKAEVSNIILSDRVSVSEQAAREKYPDFAEKAEIFMSLAQQNPALLQGFAKSMNPAEYAYTTAKRSVELEQLGGIDQIVTKREGEIRAQLEAEFAAKLEAERKKLASIPPSLSDVNGSGSGNAPVWNGPTSLDAILARR